MYECCLSMLRWMSSDKNNFKMLGNCELARYLQNVVSFDCIYGFASLQWKIIALFQWFLSSPCTGKCDPSSSMKKMSIQVSTTDLSFVWTRIVVFPMDELEGSCLPLNGGHCQGLHFVLARLLDCPLNCNTIEFNVTTICWQALIVMVDGVPCVAWRWIASHGDSSSTMLLPLSAGGCCRTAVLWGRLVLFLTETQTPSTW